jgi:hypothetical protein
MTARFLRFALLCSQLTVVAACSHPDSRQRSAANAGPSAADAAAPVVEPSDPFPSAGSTSSIVRAEPEPSRDPDPPAAGDQPITGATDSASREVTADPVARSYLPTATTPDPPAAIPTAPNR